MSAPAEPEEETARLITPSRVLLAFSLWGTMLWVMAHSAPARAGEARLAALLAGPVTPGHASSADDVVLIGLGTPAQLALRITNECTVVLLIVPMLFLAGLISLFRRFGVRSVLLGLVMGAAAVVLTNQVRIVLIAWATETYGIGLGYELTHKFFGSVLAIAGFSGGLLLMLRLAPHLFGKRKGAGR
jgi:exosortase/archaeosortase family protein